jgi:hypothetical protein
MYSVRCCTALSAAVRLLETEGHHFSELTVLGFLPSTADEPVVPQHSNVHLGLGEFFMRFTAVDPPCSVNQEGS